MTFKAPDSRTYHLALERRKGEMGQFLNTFAQLLQAIIDRDHPRPVARLRRAQLQTGPGDPGRALICV
jgi:hypothetical protein